MGPVPHRSRRRYLPGTKGLSDHHTIVVRLDRDTLTEILNHPLTRAA